MYAQSERESGGGGVSYIPREKEGKEEKTSTSPAAIADKLIGLV